MATYYFDFDTGNDSNTAPYSPTNALKNLPGTSEATGFAAFNPQPGDTLNLARGSQWDIATPWTFTAADSGTDVSPVTIQAHDRNGETGQPKPIVACHEVFDNPDWTEVSTNIWRTSLASDVFRVFFDWDGQQFGIHTNTSTLSATKPWWNDTANNFLYLYSVGNPSFNHSDVRAAVRGAKDHALVFNDAAYITFDGIDIRGGGRYCVLIERNSASGTVGGITIKNCDFGGYAWMAARVESNQSINFNAPILIERNNIDHKIGTDENVNTIAEQNAWNLGSMDGLQLFSSNYNVTVRYNAIRNFRHSNVQIKASTSASSDCAGVKVYENFVTCEGVTYGRGLNIGSDDGPTQRAATYDNEVYRNLFLDMPTASKANGRNTKCYQNVFDTVRVEFWTARSYLFTFTSRADLDNTIFANNVLIARNPVTDETYIQIGGYADVDITSIYLYNNLIVTPSGSTRQVLSLFEDGAPGTKVLENNNIYSGGTASTIRWLGTLYTVPAANSAVATINNNIVENLTFPTVDPADFQAPVSCSDWFSNYSISSGDASAGSGADWWGASPPTSCSGSTWIDTEIDIGLNERLYSDPSLVLIDSSAVLYSPNVSAGVVPEGQITFIGSDLQQTDSGPGDLTLSLPVNHQANDFGIIFCYNRSTITPSTWSIITATGWTKLVEIDDQTATQRQTAIFYKKFTSGTETNPVCSLDIDDNRSVSVHVFRGVDPVTPWASGSPFYQSQNNVNNSTPPNPSITTVYDKAAIVVFDGQSNNDVTAAGAPAGYTPGETIAINNRSQFTAYLLDSGTAGVKSPGNWTHTVTGNIAESTTYSLALNTHIPDDSNILPSLIDSGATVYSASVIQSIAALPGLIESVLSLYGVNLAPGQVNAVASIINLTATLYGPSIATGQAELFPGLIDSTASLYGLTINLSSTDIVTQQINSTAVLYSPSARIAVVPNFVFNVAKGRINAFYNRVNTNDPANSALVLVAINTSTSNAVLQDYNTLAEVLADAGTTEETNGTYSRKVLTDAVLTTPIAPDDTNDEQGFTIPDQTWNSVFTDITSWTDILVCYDSDTTSGTDANIIPITCHDFVIKPNGGNLVVDFPATNLAKAT